MANLDAEVRKSWKDSLQKCETPWIVFGVSASPTLSLAERMNGMAGLIDWHVHGQVSSLLSRHRVAEGSFCLIPGRNGGANFLFYYFSAPPDAKTLVARLKLLQVREASIAESTFPEDFLSKLKQNLSKDGIRCTKLEPETR